MIEPLILAHLIRDEEFVKKVRPFLKSEYFTTPTNQALFAAVVGFIDQYRTCPTMDAVHLSLEKTPMSEAALKEVLELLKEVATVAKVDSSRRPWLLDQTEEFCKTRAIYLAISDSITLIDKDIKSAGQVQDILKSALSVGFTSSIGHDYFADTDSRYKLYHQDLARVPFDIDLLNKITRGGLTPKTLNIVVAGTAVGKSLFLCHVAASTIAQGKNVLYVTMEMAEERIAQRIDANLLDVPMDDLELMSQPAYERAFAQLQQRHKFGQLIIKEYPTASAHAGHVRMLLDELALKKDFTPDLLIVDYINICASSRFRPGNQVNSYTYVKAIAEELRGLATERNVPLLTATQFNRQGYDSSDPSLTDTSESFGLPQTADLQIALVRNDEMDEDGVLMVKQLKNRYADETIFRRFTVTVDRRKMRLGNDPNQRYKSDPIRPTGGIKPGAETEYIPAGISGGGGTKPTKSDWEGITFA